MKKHRTRPKKPYGLLELTNLYGDRIPWAIYWSDKEQRWRKATNVRQIPSKDQDAMGVDALQAIINHLKGRS